MEFTAKKDELLRELALIQGIVERKNTIPILANVLIDAHDGLLELAATDLDVGLKRLFGNRSNFLPAGRLGLGDAQILEL